MTAASTPPSDDPERRLRRILDTSSRLVLLLDADLRVEYAANAVPTLDLVADDVAGRRLVDLPHPWAADLVRRLEPVGPEQPTARFGLGHGSSQAPQWLDVDVNAVLDGSGSTVEGYTVVAGDDTRRQHLLHALSQRVTHDPLTGLANRALLVSRLRHAIEAYPGPNSVGVLFADIDRFKNLNDSLGHAAGDRILTKVAERLHRSFRSTDTVARFGGDEFVILLTGPITQQGAVQAAVNLRRAFWRPLELEDQDIFVNFSVGVAMPSEINEPVEGIIRRADMAMYEAKASGRNTHVVFDAKLRRKVASRKTVEASLREAIPGEQLDVFLQPELDLTTKRITGVEALVRWNHPEKGIMPAGTFIQVAEESGLILDIGERVLRRVCELAAEWNARPGTPELSVRVNLSARQLTHRQTSSLVADVIQETELRPGQLCLEVAESILMTDTGQKLELLGRLRNLGAQVAIDDFGTGFSSLSHLKRFPVDVLKIDRSFVSKIPDDPHDVAIVRAIIVLGDALGLGLVAEGVETEAQAAALTALGCHRAQGHLYAKPMSVADFEAMLAEETGLPAGRATVGSDRPA